MGPLHSPARDLSEHLSLHALDVCRTYLSNGRRCGAYWSVGDVHNSRGRSLYVRLVGPASGRGAAGHWTDTATGEHGDLLDLMRANLGLSCLTDALDEARRFLSLPRSEPAKCDPAPRSSPLAAQRLFAMGQPVPGTPAERYLRSRGITASPDTGALRYHPRVFCRELGPHQALPALLAAATDPSGRITGVLRTWLDPKWPRKAHLKEPRRSLGSLLGSGVRFGRRSEAGGAPHDVLVAGEGIETMLSLKSAFPALPMVAGLSANHLGALTLPPLLRRLYIARDRDAAGSRAAERLRARAEEVGIEVVDLVPTANDFNVDLQRFGLLALRARIRSLLAPGDAARLCAGLPAPAGAWRVGRGPGPGGVLSPVRVDLPGTGEDRATAFFRAGGRCRRVGRDEPAP